MAWTSGARPVSRGNGNASTGGTSFIAASATSTTFTPSVHTGHGQVELSW